MIPPVVVPSSVAAAADGGGSVARRVLVVGLVGCSAAGKSTLCDGLRAALAPEAAARLRAVVCCDDFYRPLDECPRFDLDALPWPSRPAACVLIFCKPVAWVA